MMDAETRSDWSFLADPDARRAFTVLYRRHRDAVYRFVRGLLLDADRAADVTQEVFMRLYADRRRFRRRARFRTLLFGIALNVVREERRRSRSTAGLDWSGADPPVASAAADPARSYDLERMLACLTERQRAVLLLRHYEGFSTRETARILGCRPGTVKATRYAALRRLQRWMRETRTEGEVP